MFVNGDLKGKFIMDRNLGARDTKRANDAKGVLMYQYGRKDPFAGGVSGKVTNAYEGDTDGILTIIAPVGVVSVREAVNSPLKFYIGSTTASVNWCAEVNSATYVWSDFETDTATQGKSIFDPSPKGWKITPFGTFANITTNTIVDYGRYNGFSYFLSDDKEVYFPYNGYRSAMNGNIGEDSYRTQYWSTTPSSETNSYTFRFLNYGTAAIYHTGDARGHATPVRCVQHYE